MLHAKFKGHLTSGFEEEDFVTCLQYMGVAQKS